MLIFEFKPRNTVYLLKFYHEWDLLHDDIVCSQDDSFDGIKPGMFFKFNDGSKLFSKVVKTIKSGKPGFTGFLKLETGIFNFDDQCVQAIPKQPHGAYSGVDFKEEHILVRNPTQSELKQAYYLVNTKKKEEKLPSVSARVRGIMKKIIMNRVVELGFTEEQYLANLVKWSKFNNTIAYNANNDLGDILGCSPKMLDKAKDNKIGNGMFGIVDEDDKSKRLDNYNTAQLVDVASKLFDDEDEECQQ